MYQRNNFLEIFRNKEKLLFLLKRGFEIKHKVIIFINIRIETSFVMIDLPDIIEIKQLEKFSQKEGSRIKYKELLGIWKFHSVWKKGSDEKDNLSSSILQVLSAKLELQKKDSEESLNFKIKNSINFGLLNIKFLGEASLKGIRPLLPFYFKSLIISIGNIPIINKSLKKPEDKKMPFFSLIAISKEGNWMCARGKGGGLAIWIKS